jgi:glycosyltransferase involved in cell wall biosynthesis
MPPHYDEPEMRVIALLAVRNEERFVVSCLDRLASHGVDTYLIDTGSTDRTLELAERYVGRGLIGIEELPLPEGRFSLPAILARKEQLAATLDADWLIHLDADEARVPPRSNRTLATALAEADAAGYNAVNFLEYTFVPTREEPDHDHSRYEQTMRHYYAFAPRDPHKLAAWKRQDRPVDLSTHAGHQVLFPERRRYPVDFVMRHYLFLSRAHAIEKYVERHHDPAALAIGWHGWRARLQHDAVRSRPDLLELPSQAELRSYVSDDALDPSDPLTLHEWCERWAERVDDLVGVVQAGT